MALHFPDWLLHRAPWELAVIASLSMACVAYLKHSSSNARAFYPGWQSDAVSVLAPVATTLLFLGKINEKLLAEGESGAQEMLSERAVRER
jgi:hypothetical protein